MGISERHDAANSFAGSLGGSVVGAYVTTGQYDIGANLDMTAGNAITTFALSIVGRAQTRATIVRAFPHDEISKICSSI